ncbi:conserved hypothetical protein [Leishmania major strain Friedlin]|uniref:Uncharacterized protein n=1 Tax=Leishmania major TaxID=5664 RepID=Q4Q4E2_LEIMA|nr:conserved hypothetical protein [Leishmania major strain Friedlin]CAG9580628.1 hypothetical_protein_-_conserved [Leishmania major strain Friedlin]CAJ06066.1 conserved hypothetical protein [Leishmania major strain Friedlin]|eukprot:XP_001685806.1 conserved hypothetical protein [Leishmania major strain Friedlin]
MLTEVLETELDRMRAVVQRQLNETKQFLVTCKEDSVAGMDRLDPGKRTLTQAGERAIRTEELQGAKETADFASEQLMCATATRAANNSAREGATPRSTGTAKTTYPSVLSTQCSAARDAAGGDGFTARDAIQGLLPRVEQVFDFYAASHVTDAQLLYPAMHLPQFTTMVRDGALDRRRRPLLPELLWMTALRDLPSTGGRERTDRRHGSTLLLPRVFDGDSLFQPVTARRDLFVHERLQAITKAEFPRVLYVIFRVAVHNGHEGAAADEAFCAYLSERFLPTVERCIRRRKTARTLLIDGKAACFDPSAPSPRAGVPNTLAASDLLRTATGVCSPLPPFADIVAAYGSDAGVQRVVQQFTPRLKRCFRHVVRCPPTCRTEDARMSIDALVESARQHHLLPLISREQLRNIFLFCLTLDGDSAPGAAGSGGLSTKQAASLTARDSITCFSFVTAAVYCLAEVIYGGSPSLRQQYASPCARTSKLLVKMFVL